MQPATSNQQPATSNQQPATSNQQPATSNQQPATSNQQPATTRLIGKFSFLIPLLFLTVLSSCGSDDGGGGGGGGSGSAAPPMPIYMWVSSTTTNGSMGGTSGADTICTNDASSAGLPTGTYTHRAVIAASGYDPRNISIPNVANRPVERPDGTSITDSYADFFDSTVTANNTVNTSGNTYATGIVTNGSPANTLHCASWTNGTNTNTYTRGNANAVNGQRFCVGTQSWNRSACNVTNRLLCISY